MAERLQGRVYPAINTKRSQCKSLGELCAECDHNSKYNDSIDDSHYVVWVQRKFEFWHENIDIRMSPHTGYGLYARRPLRPRIVLGEYISMLVPRNDDLPDDQCVYQFGIEVGLLLADEAEDVEEEQRQQPTCWVDATKKGSIFRFMAHSCLPNAEVEQARVGTHHRILVVRTIRPIKMNEPITINYGEERFKGEQQCYCGMVEGHHPPVERKRPVIRDSDDDDDD